MREVEKRHMIAEAEAQQMQQRYQLAAEKRDTTRMQSLWPRLKSARQEALRLSVEAYG